MSRRTPFPASPGLPPTLYSGISSLQISQASPSSITGTSSHSHASQPQKSILKGPKTARHPSRKSEHPSSSTPWKDPRQKAAASSGHKRMVKEDLSYRQIQASWSPFPPDTRATTRKEDDIMVRAAADHIRQTDALGYQMYQAKWGPAHRRVSEIGAVVAVWQESEQIIADMRREREDYMSGELLELIATAPDEETRQDNLTLLEYYRRRKRDDELEDERRAARVAAGQHGMMAVVDRPSMLLLPRLPRARARPSR